MLCSKEFILKFHLITGVDDQYSKVSQLKKTAAAFVFHYVAHKVTQYILWYY